MAEKKAVKSTKKSDAAQKKSSKKDLPAEDNLKKTKKERFRADLLGFVLMVIGVFFFFSLVTSLTGLFGQTLSSLLFGFFGILAYAFCLLLCVVGWMVMVEEKKYAMLKHYVTLSFFSLFLFILIHYISHSAILTYMRSDPPAGAYLEYVKQSYFFGRYEHLSGGALGAILTYPVERLLGSIGTVLLSCAGLMICFAVLFKLSLRMLGRRVQKSVGHAAKTVTANVKRIREVSRQPVQRAPFGEVKTTNLDASAGFGGASVGFFPNQKKRSGNEKPFGVLNGETDEVFPEEAGNQKAFGLVGEPNKKAPKDRAGQVEPTTLEMPANNTRFPITVNESKRVYGAIGHTENETVQAEPISSDKTTFSPAVAGSMRDTALKSVQGKAIMESEEEIAFETETEWMENGWTKTGGVNKEARKAEWEREGQKAGREKENPEEDQIEENQLAENQFEEETEEEMPWEAKPPFSQQADAKILKDKPDEEDPYFEELLSENSSPAKEIEYAPEKPINWEAALRGEGEEAGAEKIVPVVPKEEYHFPTLELLTVPKPLSAQELVKAQIEQDNRVTLLEETLKAFSIDARVIGVQRGPAITCFELQPARGVKVSRITSLSDDIALNLAAAGVRIEAPIPGKPAVGIEVPNKEIQTVPLREVLESDEFIHHPSKLAVGLGKDINGHPIVADLAKMPHLLVAGQTGSGKSVCINALITSILYKSSPDDVRLILIDPKVVELKVYNDVPHLLIPVVTDPKKAASALGWAVQEMTDRYNRFAETGRRDIAGYNEMAKRKGWQKMPQIVVIIDELADLMMVSPGEVEDRICRLAQLARAAGIHLVIATQRPSVNVITGVIKANIPSRIAFAVASQVDSRTILDIGGAEKLLGKGDMLFDPSGASKPTRVQGAFVSDQEVEDIVSFVKMKQSYYDPNFIQSMEKEPEEAPSQEEKEDYDPLLPQAVELAIDAGQVSTSMLQRRFRVGHSRAGRIVDQMELRGFVTPFEGARSRQTLISRDEYNRIFGAEKDI